MLPPFEFSSIFTEWGLNPYTTVGSAWVMGAYLTGIWVLGRRGVKWPLGRTLAFGSGVLVFYFATSSGIEAYDLTLLSVHMVQHMLLSMLVPMLLAMGAPVTLALRTLPRSPRKVLLAVLHSRFMKVLSFPPLVFALYVLSPWILYFTSWYDASLRSEYIHEMMHIHLVLVGSLFFWPLVGIDPVPGRLPYPGRMLMLVLTLPFHAFLGITIMGQKTLLGGDWYPSRPEAWLPDPFDDQNVAGALLWWSGDLVAFTFFVAVFAQWVRSSMREAEREDRRLDLLEAAEAAQARRLAAEGGAVEGAGDALVDVAESGAEGFSASAKGDLAPVEEPEALR